MLRRLLCLCLLALVFAPLAADAAESPRNYRWLVAEAITRGFAVDPATLDVTRIFEKVDYPNGLGVDAASCDTATGGCGNTISCVRVRFPLPAFGPVGSEDPHIARVRIGVKPGSPGLVGDVFLTVYNGSGAAPLANAQHGVNVPPGDSVVFPVSFSNPSIGLIPLQWEVQACVQKSDPNTQAVFDAFDLLYLAQCGGC